MAWCFNPQSTHCFQKFLKKRRQFSRRQKIDLFCRKISLEFNELSMKFSKKQEVVKKKPQAKTVQKTTYMWHSAPKG